MKRLLMLLTVLLVSGAPAAAASDGVWPLAPRPPVVRGFEPPPQPWLPGHRGVDLAGSPGQRVRAAVGGTVTFAGPLAGRGVVVVSHGATRTTYEPVRATVTPGVRVSVGTTLGTLSAAAGHCPPRACLHWGLLRGDTYLDPLSLLGSAPVRLLPLDGYAASPGQPAGSEPPGAVTASAAPPGTEPGSSRAAQVVVALAGLGTLVAGLLIRRH